jgi:antitoxin (DNA-binding transcriptional repressor) of toxin-antitoxin stability system
MTYDIIVEHHFHRPRRHRTRPLCATHGPRRNRTLRPSRRNDQESASIVTTVTIEEARDKLCELIHHLTPGEEVVITENDETVAQLVPAAPPSEPRKVPRLGTLRGTVLLPPGHFLEAVGGTPSRVNWASNVW